MGHRRCLDCHTLIVRGSRCARCRRALYGGDWRHVSRRTIEAHVAADGLVCPGWARDPHPVAAADDLTTDHVAPGTRAGGLRVLCRACNTAKGGTP